MSTDSELSQTSDDMQLSMANHFDNFPQDDKLQTTTPTIFISHSKKQTIYYGKYIWYDASLPGRPRPGGGMSCPQYFFLYTVKIKDRNMISR